VFDEDITESRPHIHSEVDQDEVVSLERHQVRATPIPLLNDERNHRREPHCGWAIQQK
jgi:hypothetical protein